MKYIVKNHSDRILLACLCSYQFDPFPPFFLSCQNVYTIWILYCQISRNPVYSNSTLFSRSIFVEICLLVYLCFIWHRKSSFNWKCIMIAVKCIDKLLKKNCMLINKPFGTEPIIIKHKKIHVNVKSRPSDKD